LYVSHIDTIFDNWDARRVKQLFLLLAAFAAAYVLSENSLLSVGVSLPVILLFSLVLLLTGLHVHYMMVRSEFITLAGLRPSRDEFNTLVGDIMFHDEFVKLKDYIHHTGHIYDHVHRVAYISYSISKMLSLDYHASARGGMLHDFFLYDWRERKLQDASRSLHGREHPHIALENAKKHFELSHREADIIVKHMFPKTISLPKYAESFVVSLSDKIAAVYEYIRRR
jgi:uncharacterized protein